MANKLIIIHVQTDFTFSIVMNIGGNMLKQAMWFKIWEALTFLSLKMLELSNKAHANYVRSMYERTSNGMWFTNNKGLVH